VAAIVAAAPLGCQRTRLTPPGQIDTHCGTSRRCLESGWR